MRLSNWLRRGEARVIETRLGDIVERLQQLLAYSMACFLPGCADPALRHPLLDFLPDESALFSPASAQKAFLEVVLRDEQVQALGDLALLSGCVQVLNSCCLYVTRGHYLRSLVLVPVERPAGTLGLLLLADEQPEQFGMGEELLLATALAHYAQPLENALWEQARECARTDQAQAKKNDEQEEMPQAFLKNELVSLVGHELRAPLSIIKGYAALLQAYGHTSGQPEQEMAPERQRHYLDAIMEQTRFLGVLLNDLLDLSRVQHGKLALQPAYIDVEALCRQISQLGQVHADQQAPGKYQLHCTVATPLPPVWADADRLRQVLFNVVENAIKYSPEGGRIELEVRHVRPLGGERNPARVCITIRDQGIGIARQNTARIFQPFERLEQPQASHIPGFGLGLYIARQLVEAMGGTLDLQSCEGNGTDVTICLVPGELNPAETALQVSSLPA